MLILTTPEQIGRFQLLSLRGAVKLEALGMKHSSGRSATAAAKRLLKLSRGAKRETVLAAIEAALKQGEECAVQEASNSK
jgi:hypothetical protein